MFCVLSFSRHYSKEEEMAEILKAHRDAVRAKMEVDGTPEADTLSVFEISQDPSEKRVFHAWERFKSIQGAIDLIACPSWMVVARQVAPILEQPAQMLMYDWKNGSIGQPRLPFGPVGEGGLDDATGASGGMGGAGYKQHQKLELGENKRGDEGDAFGLDSASVKEMAAATEEMAERAREGLEDIGKEFGKGFGDLMNNFITKPGEKEASSKGKEKTGSK